MAHHEPFKALSPLAWDTIAASGDGNNNSGDVAVPDLISTTFRNAQVLIDSIPADDGTSAQSTKSTTGRVRSHTDSAVMPPHITADGSGSSSSKHESSAVAAQLRKEWKEVKVNAKENPLGISVFKMSAKDGKGSWFARRSVHRGVPFDKWRLGLKTEFAEALAVNGAAENGKSVRGLGAERRVDRKVVEGVCILEGELRPASLFSLVALR